MALVVYNYLREYGYKWGNRIAFGLDSPKYLMVHIYWEGFYYAKRHDILLQKSTNRNDYKASCSFFVVFDS